MELPAGNQESTESRNFIHLNGSTLEGGGQLIRNALTLSVLTAQPVRITEIRGNRPKGGLKTSHAAAVKFLAEVTGSKVTGVEIGSKTIEFTPPPTPDPEQALRREFNIELGTPGSVFLIFQALYPWLVYRAANLGKPVKLSITGGTNVTFSPSFEYVAQVLVPTFVKLGLPKIKVELRSRGWTTGRTQLGTITFEVNPLPAGFPLPSFYLTDRGHITKVLVTILASCELLIAPGGNTKSKKSAKQGNSRDSVRSLLESEVSQAVERSFHGSELEIAVSAESGSDKRLYLLLVAHTSNGYRLGRDWLFDQKVTDPRKAVHTLVEGVVRRLKTEIGSNACIDEHMRDQVVLFQALAEGKSHVDGGMIDSRRREPTLHTQTAMWIAEEMLGTTFDEAGECVGKAFRAGLQQADGAEEPARLTRDMENFTITD